MEVEKRSAALGRARASLERAHRWQVAGGRWQVEVAGCRWQAQVEGVWARWGLRTGWCAASDWIQRHAGASGAVHTSRSESERSGRVSPFASAA